MHRDCPEGTACYIHSLKEREGISANEAIRQYSDESGIPVKTLERWYWPGKQQPKRKTKNVSILQKIINPIPKLSQEELRELKKFILGKA